MDSHCDDGHPCGRCEVLGSDQRLSKQNVAFLLNNLPCTLTIADGPDSDQKHVAGEKRGSVYSTAALPSKHTVLAALAVTDDRLLIDILRLGKDDKPIQYMCASYQDPIMQEINLAYTGDQQNPRLTLTLQSAGEHLGEASPGLDLPDQSTVAITLHTWKAPDVALYVNRLLKLGGECNIDAQDPRLQGENVLFLRNNMTCRLMTIAKSSTGGVRRSMYGTLEAPSTRIVRAALAITKEKLLLDLKRIEKDDESREYVSLPFTSSLIQAVTADFSNEVCCSRLSLDFPDMARFLTDPNSSEFGVEGNTTVKVMLETWQAPDIAMHLKSRGMTSSRRPSK